MLNYVKSKSKVLVSVVLFCSLFVANLPASGTVWCEPHPTWGGTLCYIDGYQCPVSWGECCIEGGNECGKYSYYPPDDDQDPTNDPVPAGG